MKTHPQPLNFLARGQEDCTLCPPSFPKIAPRQCASAFSVYMGIKEFNLIVGFGKLSMSTVSLS